MLGWMHLELNFKGVYFSKEAFPQKKPEGSYKELITFLKQVVDSVSGLINRYFFLFEPNPDLFLALEAKDAKDYGLIEDKINKISEENMPKFVASYKAVYPTTDGNHPEGALDLFCASTKYAFFRITDDYETGYKNNDETKIIHCFCNQLFVSHDKEKFFYLKGTKNSGLPWSIVYECLRISKFPNNIGEFLLWDFAISDLHYKDQRVFIFKDIFNGREQFYFTVEFYNKINNGTQGLIDPIGLYSTQKEAEDKAKGLIDKNLTSGIWITKPLT